MNKRRKTIKAMALFLTTVGMLSIFIATLMWMFGGDVLGISFPRNDIVHVGFATVGAIYLVSATGMYLVLKDRRAMIEDNDERNKMIQATSGLIGFGVQTLLLFSSLFLLCFMGYMNGVSMFTLLGVCIISVFVFTISNIYLMKKM